MNKSKILRIIDANLNRSREGLRVCEDITRLLLDDEKMARKLKFAREKIFSAIKNSSISYLDLLKSRDSENDVGKKTTKKEATRQDWQSVFLANAERAKESLRVLEELLKIVNRNLAEKFKKIRFNVYEIEKKIIIRHQALSNSKHIRP